jgi:hypothetical protein
LAGFLSGALIQKKRAGLAPGSGGDVVYTPSPRRSVRGAANLIRHPNRAAGKATLPTKTDGENPN